MPKIAYGEQQKFHAASLKMIAVCNSLLEDWIRKGFDITLRQLYYLLVSRGFIPNNDKEYKCLGALVNNARLAGLIDWYHIIDRTRSLKGLNHWDDPSEIVKGAASSFHVDRWAEHKHRVEIWVEKDALAGIVGQVANRNDVRYFSCRGYTSQSEMWGAAQRLQGYVSEGKTPIIIHLGDHDPSGVDMSRDIFDRLEMFMGGVELKRVALTMEQVTKYNPPPNPAKVSDSRFMAYIKKFGHESWELDALDPEVLTEVIEKEITKYKESTPWQVAAEREARGAQLLTQAADRWTDVTEFFDLELSAAQIRDKFVEAEKHLNDAKGDLSAAQLQVTAAQDELRRSAHRLAESERVCDGRGNEIIKFAGTIAEQNGKIRTLETKVSTLTKEKTALQKKAAKGRKK